MALIGVVLAGGTALADTTSYGDLLAKFTTVNPNAQVDISRDSGAHWTSQTAGQMNWVRKGGSFTGLGGANNTDFQFSSFCVELTQHVNYNTTYSFSIVDVNQVPTPGGSGVGSGMGATKGDQLRKLWGLFRDDVVSATTAAAFQVAVWEIVYDDDTSLSSGSFRARQRYSGDAVAKAGEWLNQLGNSSLTSLPTLYGMSNPTAQDQVFFTVLPEPPTTPSNVTPVPLPSAVWAGGMLLAGLVIRRFRRHQSSKA